MGTSTTLLNAGTPNQGHSQFSSSWDDNFQLRTFDNTPNPNFVLGIGDGAGDFAHMPIFWNQIMVLNGSGRSWCQTCGEPVGPFARADKVIDEQGRVGIGKSNPNSSLQVNGYIQLATEPFLPPSSCDEDQERGRMIVDDTAGCLYVCVDYGWEAWARASEVADLDARVAAPQFCLRRCRMPAKTTIPAVRMTH